MNESEIDRLLRQQTPEIHVRPGLETRILARLRHSQAKHRPLAWIALAAACVIALLLAIRPQDPTESNPVANQPPEPLPPSTEAVNSLVPEVEDINPLRSEALALRNDAERTSRFLLDCLPSIAMGEK